MRSAPGPLAELKDDPLGARLEHPPRRAFIPQPRQPNGRPQVVGVLGSSGAKASAQAGLTEAMEENYDVIHWDLASGGCIAGLAAAAGIDAKTRRLMNAGAPSKKMLTEIEGLPFHERKGLDLAGALSTKGIETWLGQWLEWAGIKTWDDLKYKPGEPHPRDSKYRVSISIVVWEAGEGQQEYTPDQLADPSVVHDEFRKNYFSKEFPLKKFRQLWIPDDLDGEFGWMAEHFLSKSPAYAAAVSCGQWPACLPTVLQHPQTGKVFFLADGGHLINQPSRFNDGKTFYGVGEKSYPLVNPRFEKKALAPGDKQLQGTNRRMPTGHEISIKSDVSTRKGTKDLPKLTAKDRDLQYLHGLKQGRELMPASARTIEADYEAQQIEAIERNTAWKDEVIIANYELEMARAERAGEMPNAPDRGTPDYDVAVAELHGFRMIAGMDLEKQGINVEPVLGWHG